LHVTGWRNRFHTFVGALVEVFHFAFPGFRRLFFQFALEPPGSLVALLLLAGELFLAFLESRARSHSHKVSPSLFFFFSSSGLVRFQPVRPRSCLPAGFPALTGSAAATTTSSAEAAATAMSAAFHLRSGLVDIQSAAAEINPVKGGNGPFGLAGVGHFHERKTSRPAGIPVRHQADALYGPVLLEKRSDGIFRRAEIQVAYENLLHVISSYLKASRQGASLGPVLRDNQIRLYDSRFQNALLPLAATVFARKRARQHTCLTPAILSYLVMP
jgi:hypothetical protein